MIRKYRRISGAVAMVTLAALVLTGCTSEASNIGRAKEKNGEVDVVDTGFTLSTVGSFDSADTAVVLATDPDNKAVSLINMDTGKQYTLYYDGTTYVKDKYDGPMSISQIKAGDVVDVTFLKGKKKLASIKRSPEAWVLDDVYNYDLAGANKTASIGSQIYSLPDSAVVLSEGRRVEAGEVVSQDVVTISGIDHKIYSVNVDKGHGYLRLKNDQPLLGGWIEVGNSVIRQIREDMLLTVPEGSYQVVLSNNNVGCVKDITVERNKEVVLDVSDLEVAEDAVGKILFTVEPEDAKVSVDGKPVDISKAVELKYGIHQIQAEANGYDTLTRHIQVGSEYATISFKLEESRKNDSENSVSSNTTTPDQIPWEDTLETSRENKPSVSDNTTSSLSENALGTSNDYKVYVDSPKGVEVYLDGNYVGLSPVRFTKTVGRHEITLKKSGYKTKTYTIYLENTKKDETYSFSALEKESSGSNNSGNNNDDNSGGGSTAPAPLPTGKVSFSVTPAEARVSVDGKVTEIDQPIELAYGIHKIIVSADGYDTMTEEIELASESADYFYTLAKSKEPEEPSTSGGSTGTPPDEGDGNQGGGAGTIPTNPTDPTIPTEPTDPATPTDPTKPTIPTDPSNPGDSEAGGEAGDNTGGSQSGETGVTGDQGGTGEAGTGDTTEGGSEAETGNKQGNLTTETVTITQESHPIRKWFSSLFKK